jgi:hypothetical protein
MGKIDFGIAFSEGWNAYSKHIVNFLVATLIMGLLSITIILIPIMLVGLVHMALKAVRGEDTQINDVFYGFNDFGRYFVGGLLYIGVALLGVLACGIGAFVSAGILLFFFPLMIDKEMSAGQAFSECWAFFKTDWLMAIVLAFVTSLVSSAGSYALGVGALFSVPLSMCVVAAAYYRVIGSAPAAPAIQTATPL